MNFKIGKLKIAAAFMCAVVTAGSLTYVNNCNTKIVHAETIEDLENEIAANNAEIADLEDEISGLDNDIANAEYEQQLLQNKIDVQTENLNNINSKINDINIKISDAEEKIEKLEIDIENKQKDVDKGLEQFKERLRAMYVSGNDSLASALVGATDFYDILSRMELIQHVAKYDDELVTSLKLQLEQLEEAQTLLASEKENLDKNLKEQELYKTEFQTALDDLNADYQASKQYSDNLEAERAAKQADIEQYEKDSAIMDAQIEMLYELAKQEADNQQTNTPSSDLSDNSADNNNYGNSENNYSGYMTWPVPNHYFISSTYGSRWGSFHKGIDISDGATNGATIVAAESGTVSYVISGCPHNYGKQSSCGCGYGYGNHLMITHDNGLSTIYAHCADIYVSSGEYVSKGQAIATVGSTGFSTGPHLHFEVLENGYPVNPDNYL